ncbi:hypothetical protein CAMSH0001_2325 [Campylobacter showae RM3277]|uniref:Uncharacterized protein n=1 Tax=Campylobacter showae RM3277 TaxID=553219 RepID=C6RG61_9BACT|nr:hypothetical protein CAMSH0001_2325 [Campylobacter showae RM3277]
MRQALMLFRLKQFLSVKFNGKFAIIKRIVSKIRLNLQ